MNALPSQIQYIFPGHSTLLVLIKQSCVDNNIRRYTITPKTNAAQREIDRADNTHCENIWNYDHDNHKNKEVSCTFTSVSGDPSNSTWRQFV